MASEMRGYSRADNLLAYGFTAPTRSFPLNVRESVAAMFFALFRTENGNNYLRRGTSLQPARRAALWAQGVCCLTLAAKPRDSDRPAEEEMVWPIGISMQYIKFILASPRLAKAI